MQEAAILYVDVSFEESLRKNRRRFNPDKPDSILEHGLPDEKLKNCTRTIDWEKFRGPSDSEYIGQRTQVPYCCFRQRRRCARGPELGQRLEQVLRSLHERCRRRP